MAFVEVAANTLDTGDFVTNSLRFNSGDSPELTKTFGTANGDTWSYSCWLKRGDISEQGHGLFKANTNAGLYFLSTGALVVNDDGASTHTSTELFRDASAWYHIVFTGNGTLNKVYVNNSLLTLSGADPNIGDINNNVAHSISKSPAGVEYMDGYLSEIHFVDGSALTPSSFAETDDNGVWVPKEYTGSYGDNGFYLQFKETGTSADASGIGADTSGNTNHFAVSNLAATEITTDTPQNNFATLNPLNSLVHTLSEGNTEFVRSSSATANSVSTICPSNGKWYMEFQNSAAQNSAIGVVNVDAQASGTNIYPYTYAAAIILETNVIATLLYDEVASDGETSRSTATGAGTTKIGLAVDLDNQDIYVSTNGQWWGGSSFNQGTGPGTALITDLPTTGFAAGFYINGSIANACYYNFGNPGGDDTISSGNSDANGYGNFEYEVPTNYYALCTKNLAEFG